MFFFSITIEMRSNLSLIRLSECSQFVYTVYINKYSHIKSSLRYSVYVLHSVQFYLVFSHFQNSFRPPSISSRSRSRETGTQLSDAQIIAQIQTFILAGYGESALPRVLMRQTVCNAYKTFLSAYLAPFCSDICVLNICSPSTHRDHSKCSSFCRLLHKFEP